VNDDIGSRLSALGPRRYIDEVTRTTHATLESDGETPTELRWTVFHRRMDEIPANLRSYVEKVTRHAYRVTDADVDELKRAGYSEDAIFEITAAAALGAAVMRLERGLIALHESTA
jgi:alkylhydroperoxidase family enzyme